MIGLPSGTRVWLVAGVTDMGKGFDGLAAVVQAATTKDPFDGHIFDKTAHRTDVRR
jgi:transposase